MTLQEFSLIAMGYEEKIKAEMEQTRLICFNVYNSSPNKKKNYKITEFMPFYWEKEVKKETKKEVVRPTADDFFTMQNILGELQRKDGNN